MNTSLAGKWENDNSTFQFEVNKAETQGIVTFVIKGSYYPPLNALAYKNIRKVDVGVYEAEEYFKEEGLAKYRECLILIFEENTLVISRKNTLDLGYSKFSRVS